MAGLTNTIASRQRGHKWQSQTQSRRSIANSRGRSRPLATKNVQLMTQGEVLQFQHRTTTESAGNNRDDGTHELKHAERHYGDESQNSRLFAAFGVFSRHRDEAAGRAVRWNLGRIGPRGEGDFRGLCNPRLQGPRRFRPIVAWVFVRLGAPRFQPLPHPGMGCVRGGHVGDDTGRLSVHHPERAGKDAAGGLERAAIFIASICGLRQSGELSSRSTRRWLSSRSTEAMSGCCW